jgi:hypothetical protein
MARIRTVAGRPGRWVWRIGRHTTATARDDTLTVSLAVAEIIGRWEGVKDHRITVKTRNSIISRLAAVAISTQRWKIHGSLVPHI